MPSERQKALRSRPATTTAATAAARATAATGGGAAGSAGSAAGAGGAGGATGSAGGSAGAGRATGSAGGAAGAGAARGGQRRSLPLPDDPTPQHLCEWVLQRARPGGGGFGFLRTAQRRQQSQQEIFSPQVLSELFPQRCVTGSVKAAALGASECAAALGASELGGCVESGICVWSACSVLVVSGTLPPDSPLAPPPRSPLPTASPWYALPSPYEGVVQSFTLLASPQQNEIAERRIGLIMEVARTSMIHAAAPHFMLPFAVRYAAHQLNLWPRVSLPETSPTLRWTRKVGDASVFWVWGALSLVRDAKASKLFSRILRCVFLGFPTNALPWNPPPVDPLPTQGPAPSRVSQVDPPPYVETLEVSSDSSGLAEEGDPADDNTAATRRSPQLETPPGFPPRLSSPPPQSAAVDSGAETAGYGPAGAGAASLGGTAGAGGTGGTAGAGGAAGAGGTRGAAHAGGARASSPRGATGAGGAGPTSPRGTAGAGGAAGARGAGAGGTGGAGAGGRGGTRGTAGAGGTGAAGAGGTTDAGGTGGDIGAAGTGSAGGTAGAAGAGAGGTGGTGGAGAAGPGGAHTRGSGAARAGGAAGAGGAGGAIGATSTGGAGGTTSARDQSQPHLLPGSPLPAPAPHTKVTESLTERHEPESRASTPVRACRVARPRPPTVLGTHCMALLLQEEFRRKELTAAAGEGGGSAYGMKGFKGHGSKKGKSKEGSGGEQYSGGKHTNKGGKRCGGKCWYCHVEGHPWFKCRKLPDGWRPGQPPIEGSKGVHGAMGEGMGNEEGDGGAGGHGGMFYHVGEACSEDMVVPASKVALHHSSHWVIDMGAFMTMTNREDLVDEVRPSKAATVVSATGQVVPVRGEGRAMFMGADGRLVGLKRVLLVPGLCANLLSTKALSEAGMKMEMMGTEVFKATLDGRVLWDLQGCKDMHRSMWEIPVLPWKEVAARLAAEAVRGGHVSHVTSGGGGDGSDGGLLVHWGGALPSKPLVDMLRVFGCMGLVHVPKERRDKLQAAAVWAVHLGLARGSKGWLMWDPKSNTIFTTRDAKFMEGLMFKEWSERGRSKVTIPLGIEVGTNDPLLIPIEFSSSSELTEVSHGLGGAEGEAADVEEMLQQGEAPVVERGDTKEEVQQPTPSPNLPPRRTTHGKRDAVRGGAKEGAAKERPKRASHPRDFFKYERLGVPRALLVQEEEDEEEKQAKGEMEQICCFGANLPHEPASVEEALTGDDREAWLASREDEFQSHMENETWTLTNLPSRRKALDCTWVLRMKTDAEGRLERRKTRLVIKGFQQREGIDFQEVFSPVAKAPTLRLLLAAAAVCGWKVEQMDVKTAFLYGVVDEEIYMKQPEGYDDGSGRVCRLNKAIYGLKQAPRCWYARLVEALEALGFKVSGCDEHLFMTEGEEEKVFLLVYVDDILLFSPSLERIKKVQGKLKETFQCKALGPVGYYLGLHVERDEVKGWLRLHQHKYLAAMGEKYGLEERRSVMTPLPSGFQLHLDEEVSEVLEYELQRRFQSMVGSLMYASVNTRPDIAFSVSQLARVVSRLLQEHLEAAERLVSCEAEMYTGAMAAQELRWLTYLLTDLGERPRSPPVLYHRQLRLSYVASRANIADVFTKAVGSGDHQRFCTAHGLVPTLPHLLVS
ncbi:unnamed protein product [Closterium sp. NIES-53]